MKSFHNLIGKSLMNRIHHLDFLLELSDSIILVIIDFLAAEILLVFHLVDVSSGFLVSDSVLIVPGLQSFYFLENPFDGMEVVDQTFFALFKILRSVSRTLLDMTRRAGSISSS